LVHLKLEQLWLGLEHRHHKMQHVLIVRFDLLSLAEFVRMLDSQIEQEYLSFIHSMYHLGDQLRRRHVLKMEE